MPEYLSPGVYIEEFEIGSRPIEGVSTSTAGFLGPAARGQTTVRLVTSWLEYQRRFGSYFGADKYLPYAVQGFFENNGQRCYIGRVVKKGATLAEMKLKAGNNNALTMEAVGEGSWGNKIEIKVAEGTDSGLRLRILYADEMMEEIFDNISVEDSSPDYYEKKVNPISNFIRLVKKDDDLGVKPDIGHTGTAQAGAAGTITLVTTASTADDTYNGMGIELIDGTGKGQKRMITDYAGATRVATVDSNWETNPDITTKYELYWILKGGMDSLQRTGTAQAGGANTITLANAASDKDDFYKDWQIEITSGTGAGQIGMITDYVGATREATVSPVWATEPDNTSVYRLTEPTKLVLADYLRDDTNQPGKRKGLEGFKEVDEISIVYSPNCQDVEGLGGALISHCEQLKDRFAIIDALQGSVSLDPRSERETQYAAFYYPWIQIVDPPSGSLKLIPPGGYVAGIYARSDVERGVHKAPANEVVRGAKTLEFLITKGEQDILNPKGVNVIRYFPGRGFLVWGARTLSSNTLWKYINVRRLFIYIEESIEEGTQWVVFEPNNEKLWGRVRATITEFLTRVWRDGALMGTKAEEAFFVKCDRTTMTQDDIDNGRLICVIGIAPVKPAEFVIFRIAQWAGGSSATE
ncbi:MAG: phage tail sheath family protein [Candidatus Methanoperedens sp.]|nr:phage tail sheath family protein [Candidatus Methanoperedens sp.]MCZ7361572.1 phage tail sheath family protein [Candidatus Methanoperedens sp.]HLB71682.1 phage tail sheath family protein [Candidatus Methanoperedens sp.]